MLGPAEMPRFGISRVRYPTGDQAAILLFVMISAVYFAQAATLAATAPFWMDEVLALWTSRLPNVPAIWAALKQGSEFSPPLYDLFLHELQQLGIASPLGLRLASILAIYVVALATAGVARRYTGTAPAMVAACVILCGGLFGYAVQMRPYALVTAAFACALFLYDRPGRATNARLAAIALLLALAIGLHFYALVLAGALVILELVRAQIQRRPPCTRTLAAIAVAGCSILLWLPIVVAARSFSSADVGAPDYYAQPTLLALVRTYARLLGWMIVPLVGLLAVSALVRRPIDTLRMTAFVLTGIPLIIFVFSSLVSHSYADRYALAGMIGIALFFASLVQQLGPRAAPVALLLLIILLVGSLVWRDGGENAKRDRMEALAVASNAPGALPIVTGSGLRFFELSQNTSVAGRVIFLDIPGSASGDPTNRNQVMRWKAIAPGLKVEDAKAFVCANPDFYLFAQPRDGGPDALPGWLAAHADFTPPSLDRASLTLVHVRPCGHRTGQGMRNGMGKVSTRKIPPVVPRAGPPSHEQPIATPMTKRGI